MSPSWRSHSEITSDLSARPCFYPYRDNRFVCTEVSQYRFFFIRNVLTKFMFNHFFYDFVYFFMHSPTEQIYFFILNFCYKVGFKFKPSVPFKNTRFSIREIDYINLFFYALLFLGMNIVPNDKTLIVAKFGLKLFEKLYIPIGSIWFS